MGLVEARAVGAELVGSWTVEVGDQDEASGSNMLISCIFYLRTIHLLATQQDIVVAVSKTMEVHFDQHSVVGGICVYDTNF